MSFYIYIILSFVMNITPVVSAFRWKGPALWVIEALKLGKAIFLLFRYPPK